MSGPGLTKLNAARSKCPNSRGRSSSSTPFLLQPSREHNAATGPGPQDRRASGSCPSAGVCAVQNRWKESKSKSKQAGPGTGRSNARPDQRSACLPACLGLPLWPAARHGRGRDLVLASISHRWIARTSPFLIAPCLLQFLSSNPTLLCLYRDAAIAFGSRLAVGSIDRSIRGSVRTACPY